MSLLCVLAIMPALPLAGPNFFMALLPSQAAFLSLTDYTDVIDVRVSNADELNSAIVSAPINPVYVIALTADIYLSSTLGIPYGKNIVLVGVKPDDTAKSGPSRDDFWQLIQTADTPTITMEGTLILAGIVVTHAAERNGPGVQVNWGGTLVLEDGFISGNCNASYSGGGVNNNGTFAMTGGTISNNAATDDGGGVFNQRSFTMTGGTISGNEVGGSGGGVYNGGVFVLNGGTISGNRANCGDEYSSGGGVYSYGDFTMMGGVILDNWSGRNGGGVSSSGTLTIEGGAISGNTACTDGGGVYVLRWTFVMKMFPPLPPGWRKSRNHSW
ncbi:MAG: hypothetical protein FWH51_03240 [Dehalococcoidia bacterium]|nr:hypothetical protein [Dehalococcoidia bacterium]